MIKAALRNPIAVLMFSVAILVMGAIATQRLPVDLFPKRSVPVIIVGTSFRGAAPETVDLDGWRGEHALAFDQLDHPPRTLDRLRVVSLGQRHQRRPA